MDAPPEPAYWLRGFPVSYHFVQILFGISFVIVWAYIGAMLLGDSIHHTRSRRFDG